MADFRNELEGWIRSGLDERVCEAFTFCFVPLLDEQVRFAQKMLDWMVLEQLCRYGLCKSVDLYLQHLSLLSY